MTMAKEEMKGCDLAYSSGINSVGLTVFCTENWGFGCLGIFPPPDKTPALA